MGDQRFEQSLDSESHGFGGTLQWIIMFFIIPHILIVALFGCIFPATFVCGKMPPSSVMVLGLFSNYRHSTNQIDRAAIQRRAAFLIAVEEINKSPTVLPNTTIQIALGDSRRDGQQAVEGTARLLEKYRKQSNGKMPIAIVGPSTSEATTLIQRLCNGYMLPEIGYSATSISLSAQNEYNYFVRLPPSDSLQGVAMAEIIKNVAGVDSFMTIAGDNEYSKAGVEELIQIANNSHSLNAIHQFNIVSSPDRNAVLDESKLENILREIQNKNCNVVAVFAQEDEYKVLFETAAKLGVKDIKWIVSETFDAYFQTYKTEMTQPVKNIILGALSLFMENGKNLNAAGARYLHLQDLWNRQNKTGIADMHIDLSSSSLCSSKKDDLDHFIWRGDHDLSEKTPVRCTGFDFQENKMTAFGGYAPFAYDATWTIGMALHKVLYENQNFSSVSTFPTEQDRINFYSEILKLKFQGATGNVSFSSNGDRSENELAYNVFQVKWSADKTELLLPQVGFVMRGKFTSYANFDESIMSTAVCNLPTRIESSPAAHVPLIIVHLIVILVVAFVLLVVAVGSMHFRLKRHKAKIAPERPRRTKTYAEKQKLLTMKQLKDDIRRKLKNDLLLSGFFFALELFDIISDWIAYSEDNFCSNDSTCSCEGCSQVRHAAYFFFIIVATIASLGAVVINANFIKKKYIQFKKGVQDVTLKKQNEDPEDMDEVLAELEKLDNQTVLLTKYEAKQKRALVSLAVALLEDVPMFVFNVLKTSPNIWTTISITLTSLNLGYKATMPYQALELASIVSKQEKQKRTIDEARQNIAVLRTRRNALVPEKSLTTKLLESHTLITKQRNLEILRQQSDAQERLVVRKSQRKSVIAGATNSPPPTLNKDGSVGI